MFTNMKMIIFQVSPNKNETISIHRLPLDVSQKDQQRRIKHQQYQLYSKDHLSKDDCLSELFQSKSDQMFLEITCFNNTNHFVYTAVLRGFTETKLNF